MEAGVSETTETEPGADRPETKRDRVRRLLFAPLSFRAPKAMGPEDERKMLDTLADELAYLSDHGLTTLAAMLATRGEGTARCFWPGIATFRAFAHLVEPRPVAEVPALRRWFASVEGPKARLEGTLVETFDWFQKHHAPPVTDGARRMVLAEAEANARRLCIVTEKRAAGLVVAPEDADWARAYLARRAYVDEIVTIEQDRKGAA